MSPLKILVRWIQEERKQDSVFPNGAVLGTVSPSGEVRTRMLGVHFDEQGVPRFHTTPNSRKVLDLRDNNCASLTFAFQNSRRSVSLEGVVLLLTQEELVSDWLSLDIEFRKSYLVFGPASGSPLLNEAELVSARQKISLGAEQNVPASFIGFKFSFVSRIAFYSVGQGDFAEHTIHSYSKQSGTWSTLHVVP